MHKDEINKKLEGLMERNKDIFDEFTYKVSKVAIDINTKTFAEKSEFEEELKNNPSLPTSKETLQNMGFKPIFEYTDIIIDCINKMAKNEKQEEIVFNNEDTLDHNKWLSKVKRIKDGDVWISLNESLMWCVAYTHEERVKNVKIKLGRT